MSREKLGLDMTRALRSAEDSVDAVSRLRISMLLFILPFAWPLELVASFKLGLERRFDRETFLRVIEDYPVIPDSADFQALA